MKITKEELVKAFKECGFQVLDNGNLLVVHEDGEKIDRFLEVLEKISERKEKKPHEHKWQFVKENMTPNAPHHSKLWNYKFVCHCGASIKVLEKEVDEL